MDKIWNWLSSHTNCLFRILREVGAELKVFIKGLPTLQQVIQIALAKFCHSNPGRVWTKEFIFISTRHPDWHLPCDCDE